MINNNIQESYCSFEVSKLLFAKGYRIPGRTVYNHDKRFIDGIGDRWVSEYPAPTHALAIEWIRVNFGYNIIIKNLSAFGIFAPDKFSYEINDYNNLKTIYYDYDKNPELNSPQEATEAAIKYTLKNLI